MVENIGKGTPYASELRYWNSLDDLYPPGFPDSIYARNASIIQTFKLEIEKFDTAHVGFISWDDWSKLDESKWHFFGYNRDFALRNCNVENIDVEFSASFQSCHDDSIGYLDENDGIIKCRVSVCDHDIRLPSASTLEELDRRFDQVRKISDGLKEYVVSDERNRFGTHVAMHVDGLPEHKCAICERPWFLQFAIDDIKARTGSRHMIYSGEHYHKRCLRQL